jgi:hypothetical protein
MKSYKVNWGIAALILNLGVRLKTVVNFTSRPLYPQEGTPVPIE